jgi:RNase P/RNase MRP subunit POP5
MERDILDIYIDMAMQSLYGKVGSASIEYNVWEYSKKNGLLKIQTTAESMQKVWGALAISQATLDGLNALRFVLLEIN